MLLYSGNMIYIKETRELLKKVVYGGVLAILLVASFFVFKQVARADTTIINVTTTVDEDSDPGTGCSLYEAIVSANTATAYGGCTAGDAEGPNIVSVPAGTYARDADTGPTADADYPDDTILQLTDNTSVVGAGSDVTIIDGYGFNLVGDAVASLESLAITSAAAYSRPSYVWISGSNKTVSNITISNDSMIPAEITMYTEADQTIENILVEDTVIEATSGSTNPAATFQCGGSGTCQDITLDGVEFNSNFYTAVNLSDVDGVTVRDSAFNSIGCMRPVTLQLGTNAVVDNISINAGCGMGSVSFGIASAAETVSDIAVEGGTTTFQIDAASVSGVLVNASSTLTFDNKYEGSSLTNFDLSGEVVIIGSSDLYASSISNVHAVGSAVMIFANERDNAEITNTSFRYSGDDTAAYPSIDLIGDDIVVRNMEVLRDNTEGHGMLEITSPNSMISDLHITYGYLQYNNATTLELDNFTILSPDYLEAIYAGGAITSAEFRNGYIYNGRGGISIASSIDDGELVIENTRFSNLGTDSSTNVGAIYATDMNATLRNLSIYRVVQDFGAPINLIEGVDHKIANVTIVDSSGGIYVQSSGFSANSMNVDVNNVTIMNNENSADHERNLIPSSLTAYSGDGRVINILVANSVFGGSSAYTPCVITDDLDNLTSGLNDPITVAISHSYSNANSCVDLGFTNVTDFDMASTLADNETDADPVGYESGDGFVQTLSLNETSVLIGAGDVATCEAYDARWLVRDLTLGCDVGAFQFNVVTSGDSDVDDGDVDNQDGGNGDGGDTNTDGGQKNKNKDSEKMNNNGRNSLVATADQSADGNITPDTPVSSDDEAGMPVDRGNNTPNNTVDVAEESAADTNDPLGTAVLIGGGSIIAVGLGAYLVWLFFRRRTGGI